MCDLLFWFAKVLLIRFGYPFRIPLMSFAVYNMEIERFCHAFNFHYIIAKVVKMMMCHIPFKHRRKQSATIFLNRYSLVGWYIVNEIAEKT